MSDDTWHVHDYQLIDDYEPFDVIRTGDVILWNGKPRTVRRVTRSQEDAVRVVEFAKLRRSQYPSPLTLYYRSELRRAFGGIVAHRKGPLCATEAECQITADIEEGRNGHDCRIKQDETVGVIW